MNVTTISQLRKNARQYLDKVVNDHDILVVARSNGQSVIVMPLETYNAMTETEYLKSSPANRRHLEKSIAESRAGKGVEKTIEELKQYE